MSRDQSDVTLQVQRLRTGISVPAGTTVAGLPTAVETVLGNPAFRHAAQRLAAAIARGRAGRTAEQVEALAYASHPPSPAKPHADLAMRPGQD